MNGGESLVELRMDVLVERLLRRILQFVDEVGPSRLVVLHLLLVLRHVVFLSVHCLVVWSVEEFLIGLGKIESLEGSDYRCDMDLKKTNFKIFSQNICTFLIFE